MSLHQKQAHAVKPGGGVVHIGEERPLSEGALAFGDLHEGRTASAKFVLRP